MSDKTILVVDDQLDNIILAERALKKSNITHKFVAAYSGTEALNYLFNESQKTQDGQTNLPAIVLLDLRMPGIDGFETLRRIRANESTKLLPVVILTSSTDEQDIITCYELGANSYVKKPINFNHFVEVINNVCNYWLMVNRTVRYIESANSYLWPVAEGNL